MNYKRLYDLGLNEELLKEVEEKYSDFYIGRVAFESKGLYKVMTEENTVVAKVLGKLIYNSNGRVDYPAVGDWVILDRDSDKSGEAIIYGILSRKSKFSRKAPDRKIEEQIVAVNIDYVFICMSLNNDFNIRKLERYISVAYDSGAGVVVILTKADLCDNVEEKLLEVSSVAFGADVIVISSILNLGIEEVKKYIKKGKTAAFLGSSGVGKSTLINSLLSDEKLKTSDIREGDDKGRHTTTHRELILLPDGGVVIDTPGMRELQIYDSSQGVSTSFSDIEELAARCKFSDCNHDTEPGCQIRRALEDGSLTIERFNSYLKLKREAEFMERKIKKSEALNYKKNMIRESKKFYSEKRKH